MDIVRKCGAKISPRIFINSIYLLFKIIRIFGYIILSNKEFPLNYNTMKILLPLCSRAIRLAMISATVLLLTACSGKEDDIPLPDPKIYTGGYYYNRGLDVACYWDEGVCIPLNLPEEIGDSYCTSIVVSGGIIYAGGYYRNISNDVACVWVNNSRTDLTVPDGAVHAYCTSIAVYNGTVYAGGVLP